MTRLNNISKNLSAFLDMLAYAEGTSTHTETKNDGYDVIVTGLEGKETFSDYSKHPFADGRKSKPINTNGLTSNASGRYQFMLKDYRHYRDLLKLPDFGPESQDKWAIQLIKERKALPLIEDGKLELAIAAVCNLWASLPGANYTGQRMRNILALEKIYLSKGGTLWASNGLLQQSSVSSQPYLEPTLVLNESAQQSNESSTQPKPLAALWMLITKLLKLN